jgi:hypothetical protein
VLLSSWRNDKDPAKPYGASEDRSDVGFLFRTGPSALRLEFPNNSLSIYDVVELIRNP